MKVKVAQSCLTLCNPMDCPWNSPGQNTGVGSLSLLQRIFPTQGLNPGLLHCRWILYQLSHKGSPRILEWVLGHFSCVQLSVTPWTMALQAPLSMGFSRQEYWSGLPFPSLLQWVAHPFSRGSSLPRSRTGVSCIAAGFFTNWAIREAQSTYVLTVYL